MLILGEKYKFTTLELKYLDNRFNKINSISYKDESAKVVIDKIKEILDRDRFTVVVLNTKAKVDNEIIKFLINLRFNNSYKTITLIGIENFLEIYLNKCYINSGFNDISFLEKIKPFNLYELFLKNIVNYIISVPLLVFSSPIILYSIYRIKKESSGSILFKQKRIGKNGKEFECIKLRSMYLNAEKNGAKFAKKFDDRVFPWGRVMRKTRIDELPQLWNVLKGEMNLIGPRPERKVWIDKFEKNIPYYNERHLVKPGITGWAQVCYPYGADENDAKQKLMYDLYYIKHWSLFLEIKIIIRTIKIVLIGTGV